MRRALLTISGLVGVIAVVAAASTVWLVMQEPAMVADAVSTGQYRPLFSILTQQFGELFRALAGLL